jgi:transposase
LKSLKTKAGVWRRLKGWKLVFKRARLHLHSPDPEYAQKVEKLKETYQQAMDSPEEMRLLYADEVGLYRQPLVSEAWQPKGKHAVKATLSHRANTRYRVVGSLDAYSGQVVWKGASKVGVVALCRWLEQVRSFYGPSLRLVLAWDNWPVHRHPKVLEAASRLSIELLFLPTYAPWTNPIEKLWRKLKQEVIYLHRQADDWDELKGRINRFLDQWITPSSDLLKYVGLGNSANRAGLTD